MAYVATLTISPLVQDSSPARRAPRPGKALLRAAAAGNKALGVDLLAQRGFRTPRAWVCLASAAADYRRDPRGVEAALHAELAALLAPDRLYAVRSSVDLEDGVQHSFAGQFASELDVCGPAAVLGAIRRVWASADTERVRAYLANANVAGPLHMAVLIQEMVYPQASGVAFSRNPVTGLDEVVVEAVAGRGDALVQDGVTPARWVHKWGGWLARPPDGQGPLSDAVAQAVVDGTRAIAAAWGAPVDLEWVFDGHALSWVQVRSVTAGMGVALYSNRIAREVMPGLIKPLVWSVNVPLVNGAWVRLFTELIGPNTLDPNKLAKAFYYRAYFNMGEIGRVFEALGMPRDSLELLLGIDAPDGKRPRMRAGARTFSHTPRLLRFLAAKWRFDRQVRRYVPGAWASFRPLQRADLVDLAGLGAPQLLAEIDRLCALVGETAYYNIVTPLLMQLHGKLYDTQLARAGFDPRQYDVTRSLPELQVHDPNAHLRTLHGLWAELPPEIQAALLAGSGRGPAQETAGAAASDRVASDRVASDKVASDKVASDKVVDGTVAGGIAGDGAQTRAFQAAMAAFLHEFGHLSDSGNDFSVAPWREHPELVLRMVAHLDASTPDQATKVGADPDTNPQPLPQPQRMLLAPLRKRVRAYAVCRTEVSSVYTFGYGLLRDYFLALGHRLAAAGILGTPDDIFYLYLDEVRAVAGAAAGAAGAGMLDSRTAQERVAARRQEMEACREVTLPSLIYGDTPPPVEPDQGRMLTGTPTARGYYRGRVCVVAGLADFDKLQAGDVLVVPFTDVGWTPLFRQAGAVVAEAGGTLSHSSIIAREYGIPAVVSVLHACKLPDGVYVTVDGYSGRVLVHDRGETAPEPAGAPAAEGVGSKQLQA